MKWLRCCMILMSMLALASHGQATAIRGASAGDCDDSDLATYHFSSDNVDFQMTKPDGTALSAPEMTFEYGTSFLLYENEVDYIEKYNLKVEGANLTGGNWTAFAFPAQGTVAIDPTTGRMKFAKTGTWQKGVLIDNYLLQGSLSNYLSIASNDAGQVIVAWEGQDGSNQRTYANQYDPSHGWYGAVTIDAGAGYNVGSLPRVVLNNAGLGLCVFKQNDGSYQRIYANQFNFSSGTWYGAVTISPQISYNASGFNVALNNNGQAIAVFNQEDALFSRIYAHHFNTSRGWYQSVTIDADGNTNDASSPEVAIDSAGNAFAVFAQQTVPAGYSVYATQYLAASGWQGASRMDNGTNNDAKGPRIAMNDAGQVFCGFYESDGVSARAYVNRFNGTAWPSPTPVDIGNGLGAGYVDLSINSGGTLAYAYAQVVSAGGRVVVKQYSPSAGWYSHVTVDAMATASAVYPEVVINNDGQILCAFSDHLGITRAYANMYIPGQGWQGPEIISDPVQDSVKSSMIPATLNNQGKAWIGYSQTSNLGPDRHYVAAYTNAVPTGAMKVNYNYLAPTPTATASVPDNNRIEVTNRKIQPLLGQSVQIQYAVQKAGLVSIKVYNLQGALVIALADEYKAPGTYSTSWAAQTVSGALAASGVYIIHVKTPNATKTQKVVVIK